MKIVHMILGLIVILHSFILTKLIFFPYPEIFVYPYLTNKGLLPYRDILDQHFPSLLFLPINFDNLGMTNEIIARYWLIGIVALTHILLFIISRKILKNDFKAILVNVLYLVWQPFFEGWVLWLDTFMPLFLLPAFYFALNKKYFLTGLLIGLSIVFKQVTIPLSGLVFFYIFFEQRKVKPLIDYSFGVIIPLSIMLIYLINLGVLNDFIYWTVIFNLTTYAHSGTQIPTSFGFITRVAFVYLSSLFVLFSKQKKETIILLIFVVGSFASMLDRANFIHLQPSLPFVVLATIIGLFSIKSKKVVIGLILVYLSVATWWQIIFYMGHLSNKVFFFDEQTKTIAQMIKVKTNKDDRIFVFGAVPHLYQLADRLPPGNVFVFQFPWFLKIAEDRILEGIIKDNPKLIIYDSTFKINNKSISEFGSKLNNYIRENYHRIDSVGTVEIMEKIK